MSKGGAMGSIAPSFGGSGGRLGGVASILNRQNQPQAYPQPTVASVLGQMRAQPQPYQPPQAPGNGWGQMPGAYQPQQQPQSVGSPFHQPLGQFMRSQPQPIQPSMQPQPQPMQSGGHVIGPWGLAHPDIIAQRQAARQAARQPQPGGFGGGNMVGVGNDYMGGPPAGGRLMGPGDMGHGSLSGSPSNYQNLLGALGQNYNGRPMNVSGGLMGMF